MSMPENGQQHIRFTVETEWLRAIAAMVREGVTFEAYKNAPYWIIELTGGF